MQIASYNRPSKSHLPGRPPQSAYPDFGHFWLDWLTTGGKIRWPPLALGNALRWYIRVPHRRSGVGRNPERVMAR